MDVIEKSICILIGIAVLAMTALAIGIWFMPFTMWSVGVAGVAIRVIMPMAMQIVLKSTVSVVCAAGAILTTLTFGKVFMN